MNATFSERAASLEVVTYTYALRMALRKAGTFRQRGLAIGLRLPENANMQGYADATKSVIAGNNLADAFTITKIGDFYKGDYKWSDAAVFLAVKTGVILLLPDDAVMPGQVAVALDAVVPVVPVRPVHLASAIKTVSKMSVSREAAAELLEFPIELVFQALRKGRTPDAALARLRSLPSPDIKTASPTYGVEDLPGYGRAKDWALNLARDLEDWRSGKVAWSDVDTGLLLSGPPGTGKTMFASALARTCNVEFVATSCAQWQAAGHLGDLLKAMRKSFRDAADEAPCILFIDELDAIGDRSRFRGDNENYCVQVVNGLLEAIDGAAVNEGVVVIAATNFPDNIDPALKRAGRLDRHVAVELPDYDDRKRILSLHLGVALPDEVMRSAALATGGFTGADLAQVSKDARRAARRAGRSITPEDLLASAPAMTVVDQECRRANAFHEAGHVVVGLDLKHGTITSVVVPRSINARSDSYGHVAWRRPATFLRSEGSYRDEIAMFLAGMAAEKIVFGETYNGVGGGEGSDLQRATDLATLMVACHGMGSILYHPASTPRELFALRMSDPVVRGLVEKVMQTELERAHRILDRRKGDLEAIAMALMEREVMVGEEIVQMLEG